MIKKRDGEGAELSSHRIQNRQMLFTALMNLGASLNKLNLIGTESHFIITD
jgi:hypothetical protein